MFGATSVVIVDLSARARMDGGFSAASVVVPADVSAVSADVPVRIRGSVVDRGEWVYQAGADRPSGGADAECGHDGRRSPLARQPQHARREQRQRAADR